MALSSADMLMIVCHEGMHGCSAFRAAMLQKDEGGPFGAAMQVEASNHRKLRRLRAGVVSVTEKARQDPVR